MPSKATTGDFGRARRSVHTWIGAVVILAGTGLGCSLRARVTSSPTGTGGSGVTDGGGTGGSKPNTRPTSLTISPSTATMTVTNSDPMHTQQYMVTGMLDGQLQDLTTQVTYTVTPPGVVTIDANGLATSTGMGGGLVTVTARSGAVSATASLIVSYTFTAADPGMPGIPP